MSDHDRGAYTPQNDAPLSFDARQKQQGRRTFPTTLVISVAILLGLGAAIFMFYRSGVRGAGEAPVPVGAPVGDIKTPAPASAQPTATDAAAGLQIYKSEGPPSAAAPAAAPVFAAGPEQPQARPAAPVAVAPVVTHPVPAPAPAATASAVAASGATTKAAPVAAVPAPAPKPAPAPAVVAEAKPAPVPVKPAAPVAPVAKAKPAPKDDVDALLQSKAAVPAKPVAAKPAPTAATAAVAPTSSAAHGAAVVQIGAYSSAALASKGWSDLQTAYADDMTGKGKLVESVDRDGKTLFRAAVSGFASHADAVAFCVKLKADKRACIVR